MKSMIIDILLTSHLFDASATLPGRVYRYSVVAAVSSSNEFFLQYFIGADPKNGRSF
jgi:hypothetical protein